MPGGLTKFQASWLTKELDNIAIKEWCSPASRVFSAHCKLCGDDFNISNSGFSQLKIHHSGKKHKEKFFAKFSANSLVKLFDRSRNASADALPLDLQIVKAETLWALNVAQNNFSFKSCNDTLDLFRAMFADSKIAAQMQLKEKKCAYTITHGLATYFENELKRDLKESNNPLTIAFDETTNCQKKKQLDIYGRYWSEEKGRITCRFITSVFLGHATADIVIQNLLDILSGFNITFERLLTLSTDGPNVNKSILRKMNDLVEAETGHKLMEGGFCCLHIVNNSFHKLLKELDFDIDELATDFYSFFKDSAARREDFKAVENVTDVLAQFMLKHVSSRWTTIGSVAERILEQLPNLKEYFLSFLIKQPNFDKVIGNSDRYRRIRKALRNKTTECYLSFIVYVHHIFKKFLIVFQSEAPMIHKLYYECNELLRNIMLTFVQDIIVSRKEADDLKNVDLRNLANLKQLKEIEIGMATHRFVRENLDKHEKKSFLLNVKSALVVNAEYLRSNLPICSMQLQDFQVLKQRTKVDLIADNELQSDVCTGLHSITRVCQYLHVPDTVTDLVRNEWRLYQLEKMDEDFWGKEEDIDVYWGNIFKIKLAGIAKYLNLSKVVKAVLSLPHGNADPERGFSVNNALVTKDKPNFNDNTIKAIRIVKSYIHFHGGKVLNVPLTRPLLKSVSNAYKNFKIEMENLKEEELKRKQENQKDLKRKMDADIYEADVSKYDVEIARLDKEKQTYMVMIREGNERMTEAITKKNNATEISLCQKLISNGTKALTEIDKKLNSLQKSKDVLMQKRLKIK